MNKVSIIIATYNSASTFKQCLQSIEKQTFRDFEVIVVDGGSTDGTVNLAHEFNFRGKITSEPDKGIYDAWNKGIALSKAPWITFVGSDDIMNPSWLEELYNYTLENPSIQFVSAKVMMTDEWLNPIRPWGSPFKWSRFRKYMNIAHVGALHSRYLFEKHGLFDINIRIVGDYEFFLRIGKDLESGFVDQFIGKMRLGGASDSIKGILQTKKVKHTHHVSNYPTVVIECVWAILAYYKRRIFNSLKIIKNGN